MPLISKQPEPPKTAPLSVRIEETILNRLVRYCEFVDSSQAYVVASLLTVAMDSDKEFAEYVVDNPADNGADNDADKRADKSRVIRRNGRK